MKSSTKRFSWAFAAITSLTAAGSPFLAVATVGAAQGPEVNALQQGLQFYKGQTITMISPSSPGGGFDYWARALAPVMGIYLHATINVEDIAGAATIVGQDAAFRAVPDGLTIGEVSMPTDVTTSVTHTPGVNFNPSRVAFIGGTKATAACITASTSGPFSSFGSVVKSTSPVTELAQTEGATTDELFLLNAGFGVDAKVIDAFASTATTLAGFAAGDGQVVNQSLASIGPFIQGGKAKCILAENPAQRGVAFSALQKGVMTVQQAAQKYPPRNKAESRALSAFETLVGLPGQVFGVPAGVSADKVDALRAAFSYAMSNRSLINTALTAGYATGMWTGPQCKADYLKIVKLLTPISGDLPIS